jgi:hypothetical protein
LLLYKTEASFSRAVSESLCCFDLTIDAFRGRFEFCGLAGDKVVFTITATNTGNIELLDVNVTSDIGTLTCADGVTLQPLGTLVCSVTYTVTQDDIDSGSVTNTATATAGLSEWTGIGPLTRTDDASAAADQTPALDFDFTANDTLLTSPGAWVL